MTTYAEEFRAKQDAMINELGNEWVAAALAPVQAQLETAVTVLAERNAELATAKAMVASLTNQNGALTAQVSYLRDTVATLQARIAELEAQLPKGKRCELPIATVTALRGRWQKPGNPNVGVLNEVWNTTESGPQTLKVCSETSWYVEANHPRAGSAAFGSVKSYPCTQYLFPKTPISSLKTMSLRFAHEIPAMGPKGYFNAAVDAWVGGLGEASTAEVMVWPDYVYPAQLPPSNALKTGGVTLGGISYIAWTRKNSNGGDYIALVAKDKANMRSSGTIDLLAVFKWLQGMGWLKATDTLAAVNYGIEISSTEFKTVAFRMNDATLSWT
jgi:hypothetical protein